MMNIEELVDRLDDAIENVRLVRAFISDHVFPYLNQYDSAQEGIP